MRASLPKVMQPAKRLFVSHKNMKYSTVPPFSTSYAFVATIFQTSTNKKIYKFEEEIGNNTIRIACVVVVGVTIAVHIAEVGGVAHIRRAKPPVRVVRVRRFGTIYGHNRVVYVL